MCHLIYIITWSIQHLSSPWTIDWVLNRHSVNSFPEPTTHGVFQQLSPPWTIDWVFCRHSVNSYFWLVCVSYTSSWIMCLFWHYRDRNTEHHLIAFILALFWPIPDPTTLVYKGWRDVLAKTVSSRLCIALYTSIHIRELRRWLLWIVQRLFQKHCLLFCCCCACTCR